MGDMVFDEIMEYEEHMLPAERQKLHGLKIYRRFIKERERLDTLSANRLEQGLPLNYESLMAEVRALEALGERLLRIIGEALPTLIPAIIEAVLLICETLLNNMDKVLAAAFSIVKGLAEGLIKALPKLIEALPKLITGIVNFITQNLPALIAMGIELTVQLAVGLIKAIPQLIAALLSGLGQAVSSVVEIGKNVVNGLWEGIKSIRCG